MAERLKVAIAGAGGFVGAALTARLVADGVRVIALGRAAPAPSGPGDAMIERRQADLFSLLQVELALAGADVGVYLVHSMMPAAQLTQGRFDDLDIVLADNFARAARAQGLKRIVYLGGLIPTSRHDLSRHLESRLEVERVLGSTGIPVTTLRAGLIVGPGRLVPRDSGEARAPPAGDALPEVDAVPLPAHRFDRRRAAVGRGSPG